MMNCPSISAIPPIGILASGTRPPWVHKAARSVLSRIVVEAGKWVDFLEISLDGNSEEPTAAAFAAVEVISMLPPVWGRKKGGR